MKGTEEETKPSKIPSWAKWGVEFDLAYDGGGYNHWNQYYRTRMGAHLSIFWHLRIASWGGTTRLVKIKKE